MSTSQSSCTFCVGMLAVVTVSIVGRHCLNLKVVSLLLHLFSCEDAHLCIRHIDSTVFCAQ